MESSIRIYRFAIWGILGVILLYGAYFTWLIFQFPSGASYRQLYIGAIVRQFLLYAVILLLEMVVYWMLRRRLYKRLWVRLHVILLWVATIFLPLALVAIFLVFAQRGERGRLAGFDADLAVFRDVVFWGSIVAGHLFFIATIVKSFSKPAQPPEDAADPPHILDEFDR